MRSFAESAMVGAGISLCSGLEITVIVLLWTTAAMFLREIFAF